MCVLGDLTFGAFVFARVGVADGAGVGHCGWWVAEGIGLNDEASRSLKVDAELSRERGWKGKDMMV